MGEAIIPTNCLASACFGAWEAALIEESDLLGRVLLDTVGWTRLLGVTRWRCGSRPLIFSRKIRCLLYHTVFNLNKIFYSSIRLQWSADVGVC